MCVRACACACARARAYVCVRADVHVDRLTDRWVDVDTCVEGYSHRGGTEKFLTRILLLR